MKKPISLIFLLFFIVIIQIQAQDYPFVPKDLKLLSMNELMSKEPPSHVDLVYYEDGTKTTFQDVMPSLMSGKLMPKMYVNNKGEYKVLVVVGEKITPKNIEINYKNIPKKLRNMGYSLGNPDSDIVIINSQGGPATVLFTDEFEEVLVQFGGVNIDKTFLINVHQVQTLYPDRYTKKELPFTKIKEHCKETTKMLADVINYFKSENKRVFVTGFSYGAFVVQDLLAEYGNIADGYLIMVGRLDMTEEVWKSFSKGNPVMFKNGTKVTSPSPEVLESEMNVNSPEGKNTTKLAAGLGYKRYTKLLKNTDLSNVIYVYGKKDEAVGRLTDHEVSFLNSKNVKVIAGKGDHGTTMDNYAKEGLDLLLKMK